MLGAWLKMVNVTRVTTGSMEDKLVCWRDVVGYEATKWGVSLCQG